MREFQRRDRIHRPQADARHQGGHQRPHSPVLQLHDRRTRPDQRQLVRPDAHPHHARDRVLDRHGQQRRRHQRSRRPRRRERSPSDADHREVPGTVGESRQRGRRLGHGRHHAARERRGRVGAGRRHRRRSAHSHGTGQPGWSGCGIHECRGDSSRPRRQQPEDGRQTRRGDLRRAVQRAAVRQRDDGADHDG